MIEIMTSDLQKFEGKKRVFFLDASVLKKGACLLRVYREAVQGYRGKHKNISAEYGSAYHKFRQILAETQDEGKAFEAAQQYYIKAAINPYFNIPKGKEWLNLAHLCITCKKYLDTYGKEGSYADFKSLEFNGKPLVEQTFAIKHYEDDDIVVILAGTIDDIGKLDQGCYAIGDDKTTTAFNHDEFLEGFAVNLQLIFYLYAIKYYGAKYPDSIFGEMSRHRVGAFINGVFLSKTAPTIFKRSRVFFFSDYDVEQMLVWLNDIIKRLVVAIKTNTLPYREGIYNEQCLGKFNSYPCEFLCVCKAPDDNARENLLGNSFSCDGYNPLSFRK